MPYLPEDNLTVNSDIGVILPTYCEAQNIKRLILEIQALPLNATTLVIDDSSSNGTAATVKKLQKNSLTYYCSLDPKKSGLGSAITDGFRTFLPFLEFQISSLQWMLITRTTQKTCYVWSQP